jgi:hypothetical protein
MTRFLQTPLFHTLAYNGIWFATVYGIKWQQPAWGIGLACLYLGQHLLSPFQNKTGTDGLPKSRWSPSSQNGAHPPLAGWRQWGNDTLWILFVGLLGLGVEWIHHLTLFIHYPDPYNLFPWPLMALWMSFSLSIKYAFGVFDRHPLILGLFAAIGAPLSYYGAAEIAGLSMTNADLIWALIALGWGVGLPLLYRLSQWGQRS